MKLTELDKKILFELDLDGRAAYAQIARNIGSTTQVVKYHVQNLVERGAIKNFWAFVDYEKAGYSFFWAYWLKFSGLTKEKEDEIFSYFENNHNMPIVMRTFGYADAMICITTKDVFSHNAVLKEYFSKFGKYTSMVEMVVGMGFESFPRTYFLGKENEQEKVAQSGTQARSVKLSEVERKMLSVLQLDGRLEFVELAKILKISVSRTHAIFGRLKRDGVINATAMTINHSAIGMKLYRALFKVLHYDEQRSQRLYEFCKRNANIKNYIPVIGNWQMMLDIEIENEEKLNDLLREMRHSFKDVIAEVEVASIKKIEKFSQMVIEYPDLLKKRQNKISDDSEKIGEKATEEDIYY